MRRLRNVPPGPEEVATRFPGARRSADDSGVARPGKVERLPFDQHTVKALVAPRALLGTEAIGDLWANPRGTQQSHTAAREVFAFLGANDRIGIRFRTGGHEHNLDDWTTLLDFADWQFFGKSPFDHRAFAGAARGYSWRAVRVA